MKSFPKRFSQESSPPLQQPQLSTTSPSVRTSLGAGNAWTGKEDLISPSRTFEGPSLQGFGTPSYPVRNTYPGPHSDKKVESVSRELTLVPFRGVRTVDTAEATVSGDDDLGGVSRANGEDDSQPGGRYAGAYPYGALATMSLSTERVCPHCLRPYNVFMDNERGANPPNFFRTDAGTTPRTPQHPKLLPPPALSENMTRDQSAGSCSLLGYGDGVDGAEGQLQCSRTNATCMTGEEDGSDHGDDMYSSFDALDILHPPAFAFTAHYFRALPPPKYIAAAAAAARSGVGMARLAIEDYHPPALSDTEEEKQWEMEKSTAMMTGTEETNAGVRSNTKFYEAASEATVPYYSYVNPITQMTTQSQLRLLQGPPLTASDSPLNEESKEEGADGAEAPVPLESTTTVYSPTSAAPSPQNGYYKHYFKELRQLGRGTFGGVYLCRHMMCGVNLGEFAIKKIPVGDKITYLQSVLREVRILEEVRRHPNVVEYKHSWVEEAQLADFGPPVRCLFILMEYASAGSLDAYLERYGTNLSTLAVWYFFLSAVAGTAHLHEKHILHRDLKPQNLLLAESKGRPPRVLVSDFGTAALLEDISYERSGGTGTLEYMPPELLETVASPRGTNEQYLHYHTMASDVWSLGMVLYYLAFDGTLPERLDDGSVNLDQLRRSGSATRPPEMLRLIEAMLQLNPVKRPRCSDILGSSFIQSILRIFNKEDHIDWDLSAQIPPNAAHLTAGQRPRPFSPPTSRRRVVEDRAGATVRDDRAGDAAAAFMDRGGHSVFEGRGGRTGAVISDTARGLGTAATQPSLDEENADLQSSRVELLSTQAVRDLSPTWLRGSNVNRDAALGLPHTPSNLGARLSPQLQHRRGTALVRPISPMTNAEHMGLPPPRTTDIGVQTDPVMVIDDRE